MKAKLDKLFSRAFGKMLYRIALVLLGLPTMVVAFLAFLTTCTREDEEYKRYRAKAKKEAEKDGTLDRIRQNAESYLKQKYLHFGKDVSSAAFKKELEKQQEQDIETEIAARTDAYYAAEGRKGRQSFIQFLCKALDNKVLLALSIITSFPMYILLLIFSNPYARYIFERLIMMIFVAFGVVFVVFTILHFSSSNPAANVLGETATQEKIDAFNRVYGLDQPYIIQLFNNLKNLATFNLGNSYTGNEDVMAAIMRKFPITVELTVYAFLIAIAISIPIGILSAVKANQRKLNRHQEPANLGFAAGASAILGAIISFFSFNVKTMSFSTLGLGVGLVFLAEALVALLILQVTNHQILKNGDVSRPTRLLGIVLFLTICNGNIFCAVAGLILLKKNKNLEYTIACYAVLVEILIIAISLLNVFKEYVCNSFFLGIGVLAGVIVIHLIAMPLVASHVKGNRADKSMLPLGIVLCLTIV